MSLSDTRKLNEHNKRIVSDLNKFMGDEWKLRYENKKVGYWDNTSYRNISIMVEKRCYKPIRVPLLATEGEDFFTEKFLQERLDLICKNAQGKVLKEFKEHYDKFLMPKINHDELHQLLATTNKLKEISEDKISVTTAQPTKVIRTGPNKI